MAPHTDFHHREHRGRKRKGFRILDPNPFFFCHLCDLCALCGEILSTSPLHCRFPDDKSCARDGKATMGTRHWRDGSASFREIMAKIAKRTMTWGTGMALA